MTNPRAPRRPFKKSPAETRHNGLWGKDTLVIERMSQEGRGVAKRAGKIVFVQGALPQEQVSVQCTAVKRDYDEAEMIALATDSAPATQRVEPECPVYHVCGGCSLQHWALSAQQQHKQANLLTLLRAIAPALILNPPLIGQTEGFRHRLRLLVTRAADRRYVLGLRQRRSHEAVSLQQCLVANAAVNRLLQALPELLRGAPDLQGLREIEIDADSNNQLGLCFYFSAHPGEKVLSALHNVVLGGSVIALRVRLNTQRQSRNESQFDDPGGENAIPWQELHAAGELCLKLSVTAERGSASKHEMELAYQPGDFTQTHWQTNAALIDIALDWLQPRKDETALDLFSGIGNFSLPLARHAKAVHAIEGDHAMAQRVVANAERNGLQNLSAKALNLMADAVMLPNADIAIVDPPRAGAKAVCAALARSKVKRLLYVSCHPATLVRDARALHSAGFRLSKAAAVDMFPHTGHSEAIALFERK